MPQIETVLDIPTSPEKLWALLTDFAHYSAWNPFIVEAKGNPIPQSTLHLRVKLPELAPLDLTAQVSECKEPYSLHWQSFLGEVNQIRGDHYLILEPLGPTHTRLIHGENFQGPGAEDFVRDMEPLTRAGFEAMNQALLKEVPA